MPPSTLHRLGPGVLALALVGAACGSDDAGGVEASGAWARTSPMMADAGAAYMTLTSDEEVVIVSASVPEDVAGTVELHEVVPVEGSMSDDESMDEDSMSDDESMSEDDSMSDDEMSEDGDHSMTEMAMTMQEVASLTIPADGELALAPGGYHVMLLDLPDALELGETFDVTFTTDDGDEFSVNVEVMDEAP